MNARDFVLRSFRPSTTPYVPPIPRVAACYRFDAAPHVSSWFRADSPARGSDSSAVVVRLDTAALGAPDIFGVQHYVMEPVGVLRPPMTARRYDGHWTPLDGDSVDIVWTNGFAGPHIRAAVREDALDGLVQMTSDVIRKDSIGRIIQLPWAPVSARRVACPAVPLRD
jgi:hypothetical protein